MPASEPFIYALSLLCERKVIFAPKLRISALCGFCALFPLKIICRDEILFANLYTQSEKFQSTDDPMNYRVITMDNYQRNKE
jgi:hypothetical protein